MEEERVGNGAETGVPKFPMADMDPHHEDSRMEGMEHGAPTSIDVMDAHIYHRKAPARTVYHQRRNDDDTM